jgi:hypothetical protein
MAKKLNFKKLQDINQGSRPARTLKLNLIPIESEESRLGKQSITVELADNSFSLVGSPTDAEFLENPNILDAETLKIKNANIKPKDKFDEQEDPFFDLDDQVDKVIQVKKNPIEKKTQVTISKLRVVNNSIKTKYGRIK